MKKRAALFFARYSVIIAVSLMFIIPFFWMIISSFKTPQHIFSRPINWWVDSYDFANYLKFCDKYNGWLYIWTTIKLAAINIVGVVVSNAIVAYAIAFMKVKHKGIILALLLITMMMPGTVTFFPQFLVFIPAVFSILSKLNDLHLPCKPHCYRRDLCLRLFSFRMHLKKLEISHVIKDVEFLLILPRPEKIPA